MRLLLITIIFFLGSVSLHASALKKDQATLLEEKIGTYVRGLTYESELDVSGRRYANHFFENTIRKHLEKPSENFKALNKLGWKSLDQLFAVISCWDALCLNDDTKKRFSDWIVSESLKICMTLTPEEIEARTAAISEDIHPLFLSWRKTFTSRKLILCGALKHPPKEISAYGKAIQKGRSLLLENDLCLCRGDGYEYAKSICRLFSIPLEEVFNRIKTALACARQSFIPENNFCSKPYLFMAYLEMSPEQAKLVANHMGVLYDTAPGGYHDTVSFLENFSRDQIEALKEVACYSFFKNIPCSSSWNYGIYRCKDLSPKEIRGRGKMIESHSDTFFKENDRERSQVSHLFKLSSPKIEFLAKNQDILKLHWFENSEKEKIFKLYEELSLEELKARVILTRTRIVPLLENIHHLFDLQHIKRKAMEIPSDEFELRFDRINGRCCDLLFPKKTEDGRLSFDIDKIMGMLRLPPNQIPAVADHGIFFFKGLDEKTGAFFTESVLGHKYKDITKELAKLSVEQIHTLEEDKDNLFKPKMDLESRQMVIKACTELSPEQMKMRAKYISEEISKTRFSNMPFLDEDATDFYALLLSSLLPLSVEEGRARIQAILEHEKTLFYPDLYDDWAGTIEEKKRKTLKVFLEKCLRTPVDLLHKTARMAHFYFPEGASDKEKKKITYECLTFETQKLKNAKTENQKEG